MELPLTEAERQVLIALIELCEPVETPNNTHYTFNPHTLEEAAQYFNRLLVEWQPAWQSLAGRGFIEADAAGFHLTTIGADLARRERSDHPPIWYWYREYYTVSAHSRAYARFCEQLYGKNLCQTTFSDMSQIDFLIQQAGIQSGQRALDLGCGTGLFAEYLADCTGAQVWGIDFVPEAIQQALERTRSRRSQLNFLVGNLDHISDMSGRFDLLTSIDTLYMPKDLRNTLLKLHDLLASGGQMLIFYSEMVFDPTHFRTVLTPDGSGLALALRQAGLPYQTWDFSEPTLHLLRRKRQLAEGMHTEFATEGSLFLYEHLIAESDGSQGPYDRRTTNLSRYLYQVKKE